MAVGPGLHTVTLTAEDDAGETDTCEATVTVVDSTPPDLFIPDDTTVECDELTGPVNTGTAVASDATV